MALLLVPIAPGIAGANDNVETAGHVLQIALPVATVGHSAIRRDGEGLGQYAKSAALTLGLTHGLKYAVDAERPDGGARSFPSGHASISFCTAEFLRKRYGWAWGAPAYAAACFVGYSRVESEQHYTRDVLAGAVLGFVSSQLLTRSYGGVSVEASAGAGERGLTVVCTW